MCEVLISRFIPETTVQNMNNFLKTRLNGIVKIEQLTMKYNEYSSFKQWVFKYLKIKLLKKI